MLLDRKSGARLSCVQPLWRLARSGGWSRFMTELNEKPGWTFLTNHAHVLLCVVMEPEARVRDIARQVGVTERCVQRMLADLEQAGYLTRVHHGRRNFYEVHDNLPLRHPLESHATVGALLRAVLQQGGRASTRIGQPDVANRPMCELSSGNRSTESAQPGL